MLAIRLQRTGRSGHTQFRMIVQDSHFSPKRGRVVAYLGSYDPHSKTVKIDGEKASQYLANGAQPSDRVARLLQNEGIKLPGWVKLEKPQAGSTKNPDKRRSTRPAGVAAPEPATDTEATAGEETDSSATEEPVVAEETQSTEPSDTENKEADESSSESAVEQDAPAEDSAETEAEAAPKETPA